MTQGNYANVNGIKLYYEIHGTGDPLILLHGGVGAIQMFEPILPALAAHRQVIGVDLQAHGRTADVDRPMRFETMADDIAALIKHLKLKQADVMGYSLGGGVALRVAIQHSELVRKLIVVSAPYKQSGWFPEMVAGMSQMGPASAEPMKQSPMYQLYAAIAPRPEDWVVLMTKLGDLLRQDYDWTKEVKAIQIPTMLLVGDADGLPPSHIAEFFALLGGGKRDANWDGSGMTKHRLAIIPATTHYNSFISPEIPHLVNAFLDAR